MGSPTPSRTDDLVALEVLDAFDNAGLRGAVLRDYVRRQTGVALTNGQVQGIRNRARQATAVPCKCRKPENRDGGMPERWWA